MEIIDEPDQILRRQISDLQQDNFHLAIALEMANVGYWHWTPSTDTIYWSKFVYSMIGIEPDNKPKTVDDFIKLVAEDDLPRVMENIKTASELGIAPDLEYRLKRKDGQFRYVLAKAKTVTNKDGVDYLFGTIRDISQQKQQEQQLRDAKHEAQRLSELKTEFLSNMTHEFRTPLNSILGFAQLMANEPLTITQQENIDEILRSGRHLLSLISDILDLSQIEIAHSKIDLEEIDLNFAIEECVNLIEPYAAKYQVSVTYTPADRPIIVIGDDMRIKQIIINLLSNGIKYNRPNGKVHVDIQKERAHATRVVVRDDGLGIKPENMQRLFLPFERFEHRSGPIEGTGIGLTICKRYVELLGGAIGAESRYGVGSTFWIELNNGGRAAN